MISGLGEIRRRIRRLLVERYALIGGAVGCFVSCVFVLLSFRYDLFLNYNLWIAGVLSGVAAGGVYGLLKRLDNLTVAIEADRRSGLKERISTAYLIESGELAADFSDAIVSDAASHTSTIKPSEMFPHRFGLPHILFASALILLLGVVFVPQLSFLQNKTHKLEVTAMKAQGKKLVKVAKNIDKQRVPEKEELRRLAQKLENLGRKMQTGRLEKKRAMLKLQKLDKQIKNAQQEFAKANQANKTMDQAGKEIASKNAELAKKIAQQIAKEKNIPMPEAMKQVPSDKRMGELARKQGPLSESERKELEKLVEKYTKPGSSLAIPAELSEAMAKLMQNADYQKAVEIMQQLAKKLNMQNKNMSEADKKMLQEQLKQMAEALKNTDLNELAKKMRENAEKLAKMSPEELKKMMEEMKQCQNMMMSLNQACQSCQNASSSLGNSGMKGSMSANSTSSSQGSGSGGVGSGFGADNSNSGPKGKINDVKNTEKVSSQVGESGMVFSAGESKGAPDQTGAAKVPYTEVIPGYKKAAEESLQREQVPPAYRKRVKDYFGSLQ